MWSKVYAGNETVPVFSDDFTSTSEEDRVVRGNWNFPSCLGFSLRVNSGIARILKIEISISFCRILNLNAELIRIEQK